MPWERGGQQLVVTRQHRRNQAPGPLRVHEPVEQDERDQPAASGEARIIDAYISLPRVLSGSTRTEQLKRCPRRLIASTRSSIGWLEPPNPRAIASSSCLTGSPMSSSRKSSPSTSSARRPQSSSDVAFQI